VSAVKSKWYSPIVGLAMLVLCPFLVVESGQGAEVNLVVKPKTPLVGETARFVINSDDGLPKVVDLPEVEGLDWLSGPNISQSTSIINGRRTFKGSAAYTFRADKKGELKIPSFNIRLNDKLLSTEPLTFTVSSGKTSSEGEDERAWDELLYAKAFVAGSKEQKGAVYIGQEIPLRISVYVNRSLRLNGMSYPRLNVENVSFKDYSSVNRKNNKFANAETVQKRIGGEQYLVIHFDTRVTPLSIGKIKGTAEISVEIIVSDKNDGGSRQTGLLNDFFGYSQRTVQRHITVKMPDLNVSSLPDITSDKGKYLGLVGEWSVEGLVKPNEVRTGKPVTLKLLIQGQGNTDTLKAPPLNLPEFRVYDPEITHQNYHDGKRVSISWALIPLSDKGEIPDLKFATFDSQNEVYVSHEVRPKLTIKPSGKKLAGFEDQEASEEHTERERAHPADEENEAEQIIYIKTEPGNYIKMPIWINGLIPVAALSFAGLASFLACVTLAVRRDKLAENLELRRRNKALRKRSDIYRQLRTCAPEERGELIRSVVVPYLNDVTGMPRGTTADTLAAEIEKYDVQLAEKLRETEQGSFLPGKGAFADAEDLIRYVSRFTKKLLLILTLAGVVLGCLVYSPSVVAGDNDAPTFKKAVATYEQGHYKKALKMFEKLEKAGSLNPVLL